MFLGRLTGFINVNGLYYRIVKIVEGRTQKMSSSERLDSLKQRHAALDHEIDEEEKRPHPDDIHLHELKKQKLILKDEISALGG